MGVIQRFQCSVSLLFVSVLAVAAQWQGKLFNYQLITPFNMATDVIPGVQVYFIDLFDNDAAAIAAMKQAGLVPVCYFSTQYENWRPDAAQFPTAALGKPLDGWAGERWVDIRNTEIRTIMTNRIALCKQKGFVAVDPDNTDGYQATGNTGFATTAADTLNFLTFLSTQARAQGLSIGLKNTLELIAGNVGLWDFAVNEQCYDWTECNYYTPFQTAGKAVFNIQYTDSNSTFQSTICPYTTQYGLTSIRKAADQALNARPWDTCALGLPPTPPPSTPPPPSPTPPPPTAPNTPPVKGCSQGLAIPSYFYPGSLWTQAKTAKANIMIINPASGPGTAVDVNYVNTANDMKAAGTTVLGYVYTQYGKRDAALVQQDIAKYLTWYGVQGIFLDEGSNLCDDVPYYDALVAYIKTALSTAVTVLNWGTDGPECYLTTPNPVDIVLNYENTYANYVQWAGPSPWVAKYNASRFWQLVHTTPATPEAFWRAITLSKSRRAGWVYVTDDVMPNPWDTLPQGGLWSLEASMMQSSQQIAVQGPYATPCFTSGCTWMRAKGVARTVLANPASGPGTKSDPNWARMVTEMRSAGTLMLGYVYTSTSTRAAATVKSEISKYFQWYPTISGVFIDQVSTACDKLPYYQGLVTHVRGLNPNAVVVFNWGSAGSECYLNSPNAPDFVGTFEGTASSYNSYQPATWTLKYPAYRFLNTVYSASTTSATFAATVTSTATKRAGYTYVHTGGSALSTIPAATMWAQEASLVANANAC